MARKPDGLVDILQLQSREGMNPTCDKVIFVIRPELEAIKSVIF
jgi:hypothetical protein